MSKYANKMVHKKIQGIQSSKPNDYINIFCFKNLFSAFTLLPRKMHNLI